MQKEPKKNHRKRSGSPASTRLPRHRVSLATTPPPGNGLLGVARRAESGQVVEAEEGCPTPIEPGRGDEPPSPQAAGESSSEETTTAKSPRPEALVPPMNQRRSGRGGRQPEGKAPTLKKRKRGGRASPDLRPPWPARKEKDPRSPPSPGLPCHHGQLRRGEREEILNRRHRLLGAYREG
jgi:hypothetical protein